VTIQVREQRHATGLVGSGKMKLNELFSPIGAPDDNQDINWPNDLKVFIDNESDVMSNQLFPAIKKHKQYLHHPEAYKLYIKPVKQCKEMYCDKFHIDQPEEKFPKDVIIALAKQIAGEQEQFIERGDYED